MELHKAKQLIGEKTPSPAIYAYCGTEFTCYEQQPFDLSLKTD